MKKLFTLFLLLAASYSYSQVGIGTTTPDPKAVLDISGTGKGLLIPRMDSATRVAITNPPDGLMVFQTNQRKGFWYAISNAWLYIPDKVNSGDNLGSHSASQNLGMNDFDIRFRSATDTNHGMGWYGNPGSAKNWLSNNIDGPVLYGNLGGVLGTKQGGRQSVLIWNNAGRVGINTPNPQQTLDVNGTAQAQQFVYSTPQTHYLSIPLDAFSSNDPGAYQAYRQVGSTLGGNFPIGLWLYKGAAGQQGFVSAPVNLPDGATITNLEITAIDNDGPLISPQATLSGLAPNANTSTVGIGLNANVSLTAESPNLQTVSVAVAHVVNNSAYTYKVAVKLNQNAGANSVLYGVRITYTVPSPD